ncbi:MAG: peptidoglycan-associated lipoprotein Pal [Acidobacteria bacterium]|nr:peptidoglycan-associated lipoprotein Pal [Acidobacteriota bacterium]MCI0718236.1 peptidoglycan-associated lipoprotein Pal [Acidobacteriota bacterium]
MNKQKYLTRACTILCLLLLMLAGGCKKKAPIVTPPAPPPPPPPAAAPTVTLSANPSTIERGQSSTLSWTSTGATSVSIDQGIGDVSVSGSRSVSPSSSTTYTITAKGEGGTAPATARITVTAPPAPPPPTPRPIEESLDEQFNKRVRDVYFDYDKSDIRDDQKSTLSDAGDFLKANSGIKFTVEGHCDERGSEEYNLGLGDRRANAVKNYLISLGVDAGRINPISYGKERPQCREATEDCYQKNRRGHFVMTGR